MSILLFLFAACSSKTTEPAPKDVSDATEAPPVTAEPIEPEVPEVPAEPKSADEPLMAAWGQSCEPLPDGVPGRLNEVEEAFATAGIDAKITLLPVCKACRMCPTIAVQIEVAPDKRAEADQLTATWMAAQSPTNTP